MTLKNTLIGIAIGDAFGVGIEFQDRRWIRENVDFTRFVNQRTGRHGENYESGFYSDDTEHSIGVLKAIMDSREFSVDLLLDLWKSEYETDKAEKGFPRQGHGSIKDWYEGKKPIEAIQDSQRDRDDPGNAPPMRAVPLGFADPERMNDYAIINADATHPHPKARAASILIARATEYLVVNAGEQDKVIDYCKRFIEDEDTLRLLERANRLDAPNKLDYSGYGVLCGPQPIPFFSSRGNNLYGLPCASMRTGVSSLYIVKHSPDAFTGLKHAINLGGDVDSVAAICSGILAGRFGVESLPSFMLKQTEGLEKMEKLASEFETYQRLHK